MKWNLSLSPLTSSRLTFLHSTYDITSCFWEHDLTDFCLYPFNRELCYSGSLLYFGLFMKLVLHQVLKGQGIFRNVRKGRKKQGQIQVSLQASCQSYLLFLIWYWLNKPRFIIFHTKPIVREGGVRCNFCLGLILFNMFWAHDKALKSFNYSQVPLSLASLSSFRSDVKVGCLCILHNGRWKLPGKEKRGGK